MVSRGRAVLVAYVLLAGCGILPERVSRDDGRLKPMFEAMSRVDRRSLGFTDVAPDAPIKIEWGPRHGYDVMLHITAKTARTVAFRRTPSGYDWIGEQEIFQGPAKYQTPDGEFSECITITFERVHISGVPLNRITVDYWGDDPELSRLRPQLTLDDARPRLNRWGYY